MKSYCFKYSCALLLISALNVFSVNAQKLADVQSGKLLINKIKVDGKTDDWAMPLKAFNKSTGLAYTIANDDKKLYVVIQAHEPNVTRKILMGGITFSINEDGKKKTKEPLSLTYPVITRNSFRAAMGGGGQRDGGYGSFQTMTQTQRDSMQLAFGKKQITAAKEIKIFGFKEIADTLVSIYNEYSIKAIANLDDNGIYTYEIGIPLALLPIDDSKEFGYNIKVNGLQLGNSSRGGNSSTKIRGGGDGNRGGFSGNAGGGGQGGSRSGIDFQDLMTPTDFWGKYTIAK